MEGKLSPQGMFQLPLIDSCTQSLRVHFWVESDCRSLRGLRRWLTHLVYDIHATCSVQLRSTFSKTFMRMITTFKAGQSPSLTTNSSLKILLSNPTHPNRSQNLLNRHPIPTHGGKNEQFLARLPFKDFSSPSCRQSVVCSEFLIQSSNCLSHLTTFFDGFCNLLSLHPRRLLPPIIANLMIIRR